MENVRLVAWFTVSFSDMNYDKEVLQKMSNSGALRSARTVIQLLQSCLPIKSVLDVGAGQGAWLSIWYESGVTDIFGIDGEYVDRHHLLIPDKTFIGRDLREPFDLSRKFDLVQSLEVGEHIPEDNAESFVASLVAHGDVILFSAAAKGQGGDNHVNEQDYEYWRKLFEYHNYKAIDYLRPLIENNRSIEAWYRYNMFLYVSNQKIESLPVDLGQAVVGDEELLQDISPVIYRLRKALVRFLPVKLMTSIAKVK